MFAERQLIIPGALAYGPEGHHCRIKGVYPLVGELGRLIVLISLLDSDSTPGYTEFAVEEEIFRRDYTPLKIAST